MESDRVANWIKVGAVATAIPRWVVALLASEGFVLPSTWLFWWVPLSAIMSAAMALVEGLAFMYLFNRWGEMRGNGRKLLTLAGIAAVSFIAVLTPSIAASVRGVSMGTLITSNTALYLWSVAVAASTISIVVAVGYAQRAFPSEMEVSVDIASNELRQTQSIAVEGDVLPALSDGNEGVPITGNGHTKQELVRMLKETYPEWTYAQLAEGAGCSVSTVSKALRE